MLAVRIFSVPPLVGVSKLNLSPRTPSSSWPGEIWSEDWPDRRWPISLATWLPAIAGSQTERDPETAIASRLGSKLKNVAPLATKLKLRRRLSGNDSQEINFYVKSIT